MTATGLIVGLVLIVIAVIALIMPFVQENRRTTLASENAQKKRDELLTSYERVLATIRDLDEDHQTGKIDDRTYQKEREYWTEQGILLLQELEPDSEVSTISDKLNEPERADVDKALDDAIEKAIAEYRGVRA